MRIENKTNHPSTKGANRSIRDRTVMGYVLSLMCLVIIGIFSLAMAAPSTMRITIGTFSPYYSPELVHVGTGIPISWENPTATIHSITHDGCKGGEQCAFDSGAIGPNRTFTVDQLTPGHYPYHCTFHPIMRGTLVVKDPQVASDT